MTKGAARFSVVGCDFEISGAAISSLALLLHELATNSAKYGALSAPSGQIDIHCTEQEEKIAITWTERAGPAVEPDNEGFGGVLLRAATSQLGGEVTHDWKRPEGLVTHISIPRARLTGVSSIGGRNKVSNENRFGVERLATNFYADFFFGTFLPFERALESPIATACFLLFTVLPLLPLLSVPALRRSMARLTSRDADFAYLGMAFSSFSIFGKRGPVQEVPCGPHG
jgi:hypothetical protein